MQSCGKTANQVENNVFEELGIYQSGSGTVCERLYWLWRKGIPENHWWVWDEVKSKNLTVIYLILRRKNGTLIL